MQSPCSMCGPNIMNLVCMVKNRETNIIKKTGLNSTNSLDHENEVTVM